MTIVLATASVVPLLSGPSLEAGLVSQLVLGEAARVTGREGAFGAVQLLSDGTAGWLHEGYLHAAPDHAGEHWLANAAWSEGAWLDLHGVSLRLPHRGRAIVEGDRVRLPTGSSARVTRGRIRPLGEVIADTLETSPAVWAWREFAGAPYLWGGVTTSGIDAAALVQVAFALRGVPLPRRALEQAELGVAVTAAEAREGDLLFLRSGDAHEIGHVAMLLPEGHVVHSSVAAGAVVRERWHGELLDRLVTVRRLT